MAPMAYTPITPSCQPTKELLCRPKMVQAPGISSTEVLAGLVERVTFHNLENGFCVLRVKARGQRDLITVLGHAAMISAGEFVQASSAWVSDRTHGLQFRASFLRATAPTTTEGIDGAV
jgi:exodeoxyribonuclease V alpha subunit